MFVAGILCALAAGISACSGGGNTSQGGNGGPDPGTGGGSGNAGGGTGSTGACGLSQATGVDSAGPAEGAWTGAFPILSGIDIVFGGGVVADDGSAVFNVANQELWVGSVLAAEDGSTASNLTRYERPSTGGAGGPRTARALDGYGTGALVFDGAVPRATLSGAYSGFFSYCEGLSLEYDEVYQHSASLQEIAGVYSASERDGYTLTVTVHEDGQLDGSDTRGCVLFGTVTVPDPEKNVYRAVARASNCAELDGEYEGLLSLRLSGGRLAWLDLALVAPETAIFYRLSR